MSTLLASSPKGRRRLLGLRQVPGRFALAVFRLPLFLYHHGRGRLLGRTFLLLVHAGRRTGHAHEMVAMVLRDDRATGEVVIISGWGPDVDWVRNLRARPALRVEVGRDSFTPVHRFLDVDEAVAVGQEFRVRHPRRMWLASRILGWGDLTDDDALRAFVSSHPLVAFRPAVT